MRGRSRAGRSGLTETLEESIRRHLAAKVDVAGARPPRAARIVERAGPEPGSTGRSRRRSSASSPRDVDPHLPVDTDWKPVDELPPLAFDHGELVLAGARAAAREALVHERRLRARPGRVHPLRAARSLRRGARPRGLGHEPEARAAPARGARADGRPSRARSRGRPAGRGLSLPGPAARDHRPVRDPAPAGLAAQARSALARRVPERLRSHLARDPVAEDLDLDLRPGHRGRRREVGVGDRALDRVAVAPARDPPASSPPTRTGSEPSATARGSVSVRQASRRSGSPAATSASLPTKSLSSLTAKPSPASYGVSSAVMSAPQTR